MFSWTLLIHLAATWTMVGVIWIVQIVHYPLFSEVGVAGFSHYEAEHTRLISYIVMPVMLLELGASIGLVMTCPSAHMLWSLLGLVLVLACWLSTFFFSVPQHSVLSHGFSQTAYERLVGTNWIRTVAWTTHGFVLLIQLALQLRLVSKA